MPVQPRAAYYKQNMAWSVSWPGTGMRRVQMAERFETAIRQLLMTAMGSLYADPEYGTVIYKMRGQALNPGKVGVCLAQLRDAVSKYIPDIQITDMSVEVDQDQEKLKVSCVWIIRNATAQVAPAMTGQKTLTVLI